MSHLGKANKSSMGLPRSGGGSKQKAVKRAWEESSSEEPPTKLLCTSPPHALCAEDVPQRPHQPVLMTEYPKPDEVMPTRGVGDLLPLEATRGVSEDLLPIEATCGVSDDSDTEDRDFLDEEDKDSGFIDSNSIDNSSDDDIDVRLATTVSSDANSASDLSDLSDDKNHFSEASHDACSSLTLDCQNSVTVTSTLDKLSLSGDSTYLPSATPPITTSLPSCSSAFSSYTPLTTINQFNRNSIPGMEVNLVPTTLMSSMSSTVFSSTPQPVAVSCVDAMNVDTCPSQSSLLSSTSSNSSTINSLVTLSEVLSTSIALSVDILSNPSTSLSYMNQSSSFSPDVPSSVLPSISTVTRVLECPDMPAASVTTGTTVTSAYHGTVSTAAYDPPLSPAYSPELHLRQNGGNLVNGTWSCNFYDSNQPTNKYMEIQSNKMGVPSSSQAIQCDANGKCYMDLGSSSPYTQGYSNECANYTTSPSNNYSNVYTNQTYSNSNYNQQPPPPPPAPQQQPPPPPPPQQQHQQHQQPSQSNQFYRPNYSHYNYPNGENYPANYEGDAGCSYGYPSGYSPSRSPKLLPPRCSSPFCDPTKASLRSPCYQHQRLSVLNVSMCKLNRFSKYPDPSLHKSVLICNTLRLIEKELEAEGTSMNTLLSQQHMLQSGPPPALGPSEGPLPPMHPPIVNSPMPGHCTPPPVLPPPIVPPYNNCLQYRSPQYPDGSYDDMRVCPTAMEAEPTSDGSLINLRSMTPPHQFPGSSGQLTNTSVPFQSNNNSNSNNNGTSASPSGSCVAGSSRSNSGSSTERSEGGINWCSVLSLPSQSDLDSLNNNEYCEWGSEAAMEMEYSSSSSSSSSSRGCAEEPNVPQWKLPSLSVDDVLKSFPEPSKRLEPSEDLDNLINVLVDS